ncbi:MAG: SDR family NAD(P)-dependent oxidoreductase [Eudoraea sp.]|uniref:SDR family NAD(P)-dependent oxidoreductase n=1 Tax=Eudoraea sp. TaxID=1979955 RepID=UPI003C74F8D8
MIDFKTKYGPWAIIAGASEGLGAAFAEALAKRHLNLVLIARRSDKLEQLSHKLRDNYPIEIINHSIDLADFEQTKLFFSELSIDIGLLVYNAAYAPIGYFENIPEHDLDQIVNVNIKTPLLLTKLVSAKMIEMGKGGIVLMSSLAGSHGSPKIATYAASKAFNIILAEGLWNELKRHGIDVLASCAGAITTPGYTKAQNAKEAPGTLDAATVAEKTIKALGKGPTTVPGTVNKVARFFMGRLFSRKFAISIMDKNTQKLS